MNSAQIIGAITVIMVTQFILTSTLIWRPRMLELMNDRDIWRTRAIQAEDKEDAQDIDIRVLTEWGSATEDIVDTLND